MTEGQSWEGRLVRLRAIEPGDWEAFDAFDRDSEMLRLGWRIDLPRSEAGSRAWAERESARTREDDNFRLTVVSIADGVIVGSINVHAADPRHRAFEFGIAFGRQHIGYGYGRETLAMVLRYMFEELGYHSAHSTVYAFNERSQRFHEAFGFTMDGRLRENHFAGGRFHDELIYAMTADEFAVAYGRTL